MVDETQNVKFTNHARAQNVYRKIKENIEAHEDPDALDQYMQRESVIIDALHLFDRFVAEDLHETYENHRACLVAGLKSELERQHEKTF